MILVILFTTTIPKCIILYYYKCAVCSLQYRKENKVFYHFIIYHLSVFWFNKQHEFEKSPYLTVECGPDCMALVLQVLYRIIYEWYSRGLEGVCVLRTQLMMKIRAKGIPASRYAHASFKHNMVLASRESRNSSRRLTKQDQTPPPPYKKRRRLKNILSHP